MPRPLFASIAVSLASLVLSLGPSPAFAQSVASGVVVDPQGGAVVRAIVRAIDAGGKDVAVTLTDANGRFAFASLSCGNCKVEASRAGFTPATTAIGGGEIRP